MPHRARDTNGTKRKRPWGAGVFGRLKSTWGLGVLLSTWRLWGAGKEPREFLQIPFLAHHRCGGVGDRDRRAGLDDARRLRVAVIRTGTSGNAKACDRDARDERHDHDLEVGRAISAVDRVVHLQVSCRPTCREGMSRRSPGRFNNSWPET